jgi:hypothetical protein
MNWDRVGRENRARHAARRAPSGRWEVSDNWEPHDQPEVDRWLNAQEQRQRRQLQLTASAASHQPRNKDQATGLTEDKRRKIERAILARWEKERANLFTNTDEPVRKRCA